MEYRVTTHRGGIKEVIWDIDENNPKYPNPSEISEAASKEFPNIETNKLVVIPAGGGDAIILKIAR